MTEHEMKRRYVLDMLAKDPDLNLYLLAFDCPDLEDAALEIADELSV